MNQPHVWIIGDWEQVEFAPAVTYLRREANLDLLQNDVRGSGVVWGGGCIRLKTRGAQEYPPPAKPSTDNIISCVV